MNFSRSPDRNQVMQNQVSLPSILLSSLSLRPEIFSDGLKFTSFTTRVAVMGTLASFKYWLCQFAWLTEAIHLFPIPTPFVSLIAGIPFVKFTNRFENSAKLISKQSQVAARWKKLSRSLLLVSSFARQPPSTKSKFRGCCADHFSLAEVRKALCLTNPSLNGKRASLSEISHLRELAFTASLLSFLRVKTTHLELTRLEKVRSRFLGDYSLFQFRWNLRSS